MENVDEIAERVISRLKKADLREKQPLTGEELLWLVEKASSIFKSQPILAEIEAPVIIVGDMHGQFSDLIEIFERNKWPPKAKYLFLGDYVDRGEHSVHTIALLFALKVRHPKSIYLLRGNHESPDVNSRYGFKQEIAQRYGGEGDKIYDRFTAAFGEMSLAGVVSRRIVCMHGGISPQLSRLRDIRQIQRPIPQIPDSGLVTDLLWSDPKQDIKEYGPNARGVSVCFGSDAVANFCESAGIDTIVVPNGFLRQFDSRVVTIFSARDYGGGNNDGAVLIVKENLALSFEILPSKQRAPGQMRMVQQGVLR